MQSTDPNVSGILECMAMDVTVSQELKTNVRDFDFAVSCSFSSFFSRDQCDQKVSGNKFAYESSPKR